MRLALSLVLALGFLAPIALGEDEKPKPAPDVKPEEKPGEKPGEKPDEKAAPKAKREYGTRQGPTVGREGMWPAPTAKDWAKPCLLTFQRTWEDAVAVSKATGKPILCCISMDGEIASEHYAGKRYREPAIAELYKPYVCVIASVYRHTPRDYDEKGHRILCPRFGSVTCGEHIAIEPLLFEKFLDGKRIAPRHVMVDLDGNEVYDIYYANDTASVFDAVRDGPEKVAPPKADTVRGDRPILDRVASRDIADRKAVEKAYVDGNAELRKKLLEKAGEHGDAEQLDLMRLAVQGLDTDMAKLARKALAETKTKSPIAPQLISDALQAPMETTERDALISALKRLGQGSQLARWLAGVHKGLSGGTSAVDPRAWAEALGTGAYPAPRKREGSLDAEAEDKARAAYENPKDPAPRLAFAESTLKLALETRRTYATNPNMGARIARHLYTDARKAALEAEKLGAEGWRVHTAVGLSAYYGGDAQEGYRRSELAMKDLPPGEPGWSSYAIVTVYAESRWKAIKAKVKASQDWPPQWLTDLHAAYSVLQKHPLGTDDQVVWHYEFLTWLGAQRKAGRVLRSGLERFKTSTALHQRLRDRIMRWQGPGGLEASYQKMLEEQPDDAASLAPFAGSASVDAAHQFRRRKQYKKAQAAYGRAISHFDRALKSGTATKASIDASVALALAGRARVAYQLDEDDRALRDILASFDRSAETAGTRDGMGVNPGETAQMLLARLNDRKKEADAASLQAALDKIDPELLRPDRP